MIKLEELKKIHKNIQITKYPIFMWGVEERKVVDLNNDLGKITKAVNVKTYQLKESQINDWLNDRKDNHIVFFLNEDGGITWPGYGEDTISLRAFVD